MDVSMKRRHKSPIVIKNETNRRAQPIKTKLDDVTKNTMESDALAPLNSFRPYTKEEQKALDDLLKPEALEKTTNVEVRPSARILSDIIQKWNSKERGEGVQTFGKSK